MSKDDIPRGFTEDGRLYQVEYAIKNISDAGAIFGITCTDGSVLLGINKIESSTKEKIYKLHENLYCAGAGIFSDVNYMVKHARNSVANFLEEFDKLQTPGSLASEIGFLKQKHTHIAGSRPFAVSMIYTGSENGNYALYSTNPSGTVSRWKVCGFGKKSDSILSTLKKKWADEDLTIEQGLKILIDTVKLEMEGSKETISRVEILLLNSRGGKFLTIEEIESLFIS